MSRCDTCNGVENTTFPPDQRCRCSEVTLSEHQQLMSLSDNYRQGAKIERERIVALAKKLHSGWYKDTKVGQEQSQTIGMFLDSLFHHTNVGLGHD